MRCAQVCACKTAMQLQLPSVPLYDGVSVTTAKNVLLHITVQLMEAVTSSFCTAAPEGNVTLLMTGGACQKDLLHTCAGAPFWNSCSAFLVPVCIVSTERQEVFAHKVHIKMQYSVCTYNSLCSGPSPILLWKNQGHLACILDIGALSLLSALTALLCVDWSALQCCSFLRAIFACAFSDSNERPSGTRCCNATVFVH